MTSGGTTNPSRSPMSEQSVAGRLRVTNRLEELRTKHGHEDGWPEAAAERAAILDTLESRVGREGAMSPTADTTLPGVTVEVPSRGVMPPASPGLKGQEVIRHCSLAVTAIINGDMAKALDHVLTAGALLEDKEVQALGMYLEG